jgi:transaldolase
MNPLIKLHEYGQSFWYDNIRRQFLMDGTIKGLIDDDGLRGMTSNPSIFDKAIGNSDDYDEQISKLASKSLTVEQVYESLAIFDIKQACNLFKNVYESSSQIDGYVSLEVSPHLANDTDNTISEAKRLFGLVDRPNLMIKVPATAAGIPAVRELIGNGININVTLMFSMAHYEAVANAYLQGIESLLTKSGTARGVASVASFFVSRVDSAVDRLLIEQADLSAKELLGKSAVANSKVVYQRYRELFTGAGFAQMASAGVQKQRLLWASTSTKNPDYSDTLYVDELIGPDTVNTMPPVSIEAFRDHGTVSNSLESELEHAEGVLAALKDYGVDLNKVTDQLQVDGVTAFANSYDQLLATLEQKVSTHR